MPENDTTRFLGDPSGWTGARLELADIHGLWGGCNVVLRGDGSCTITRVQQPPHPDGTVEGRVAEAVARQVLEHCVAQDLLTIRFPARSSIVPDETHTQITLINAAGVRHTVGRWANDPPDPRFTAIYTDLLRIGQGDAGTLIPPPP